MKRSIIVLFTTAIILSVMWINSSKKESTPTFDISIISPAEKNLHEYINAEGRIKEGTKRDIFVRNLSQIGEVFVKEGSEVKKGSPLFEIKPIEDKFLQETYHIEKQQVLEIFQEYGFEIPDEVNFSFVSDEETIVRSPIDGIITDVNITPGENVNMIKKLVSVSDFSDLYIDTLIPEAYSARVRAGAEAKISAEAFGDTVYSGRVESVSPVAKHIPSITGDGKTYINALLRTNTKNTLFKPELSVNAKITIATKNKALTIPYECIRQNDDGSEFVYCVKDGRAVYQVITTGRELDNETEVTDGITKESVIVFNPTDDLYDGAIVKISDNMEH